MDSDLVDRMGRAIADTAAVVTAVRRSAPALRTHTADLKRLHAEHLEELGWSGTRPKAERVSAASARSHLATAEKELQATLIDGCIAANSGALAQLLAAMAAAVAQRQVGLA